MPMLLVGVNHKTAPLAIRERFALSDEQGDRLLERLVEYIPHGVVLATCNRTEIYTTVHNAQVAESHLQRFLADWTGIPMERLAEYLYTHEQWSSLDHLFRVACGLDSMILGEEQILGQVRSAMERSEARGALDSVLGAAFRQAVRTGRKVRSQTAISRNAVSVSSVAVQLAKSVFGDLAPLNVLVISAGEAGKIATNTLMGQGVRQLHVTNRNRSRAEALAQRVNGSALPFEQIDAGLEASDFIITSTGAADHILTLDRVEQAMAWRPQRPLLIVDIAVPRDVEPAVASIPGVSLYNIDDVQAFAERNLALRAQEVEKAEAIVAAEVGKYQAWWRSQEVVPTIAALRHRAEVIREDEVLKTLRRMPDLSPQEHERITAMSKAIVSKLLHDPLVYLKERRNGSPSLEAVRELFGLADDGPDRVAPPGYKAR